MIVEICANSFESAKAAQEGGADRIELCSELSVGGITPSFGLIEEVLSKLTIPIYVLIRPRSGNFTYSESEMDVMLKDIRQFRKMGVSGIVSGALTSENDIDIEITKHLLVASKEMDFTFHRAFDWTRDPKKSLKLLQQIEVKRILTSGQQPTAFQGLKLLKELQLLSDRTIEIMPGGGINLENVMAFKDANFSSVHLSATVKKQLLSEAPKVSMHSLAFFEEGVVATSDKEIIQKMRILIS